MSSLPNGLPSWMYGIDNIQQRIGQAADEGGIDLGGNKIGQPLQALNNGTIVGAGYFCHGGPYFMTSPTGGGQCGAPGYGVVTIRMDTPYGMQDLYYQHINIDPSIQLCTGANCKGQQVMKGQVIGTGGVGNPPQNLLEMGVNVPWGGIWGQNHPGPWKDPEQIIRSLMNNYGGTQTTYGAGSSGTPGLPGNINTGNFGFDALYASVRPSLIQWGEIIGIFLIALAFIIVGIYLMGGDPGQVVQAPVNYVQTRREMLK